MKAYPVNACMTAMLTAVFSVSLACSGSRLMAQQPFQPQSSEKVAELGQILAQWEQVSNATKTYECQFKRWHFDSMAAPKDVFSRKSEGVLKYAKPDKGLFRVDSMIHYQGMKNGKPVHVALPNRFGEYWVATGEAIVEYDRENKQCSVHSLPPEMQGQNIASSPLPFVFNLNAEDLKSRYWIMLNDPPSPDVIMMTAWPKKKADRAQYKIVQIALNKSFEPIMLRLYVPNFDPKTAPQYDQYEFTGMKRNDFLVNISQFFNNFIPEKPKAGWKVVHYNTPVASNAATAPAGAGRPINR